MHMMSVRIDFGVMDHRRDRRERSFSRSSRVVCLQSSLALDQRRRLESGYKHGQVRFHLSDDNAARFVVKMDMVVYNFPRYKVVVAYFLNGRPRSCEDILATEASFGR